MVFRRLDWADIEDFFCFGVGDASGSQQDNANNNKDDTDNRKRSHACETCIRRANLRVAEPKARFLCLLWL